MYVAGEEDEEEEEDLEESPIASIKWLVVQVNKINIYMQQIYRPYEDERNKRRELGVVGCGTKSPT